jgi:hypothetical protein
MKTFNRLNFVKQTTNNIVGLKLIKILFLYKNYLKTKSIIYLKILYKELYYLFIIFNINDDEFAKANILNNDNIINLNIEKNIIDLIYLYYTNYNYKIIEKDLKKQILIIVNNLYTFLTKENQDLEKILE